MFLGCQTFGICCSPYIYEANVFYMKCIFHTMSVFGFTYIWYSVGLLPQ
jgi:hypothetical protein